MRRFLGIKARTEPSAVSGSDRRIYTGERLEMIVPFYDNVIATDSVPIPLAYLVPPEWKFAAEILKVHGIIYEHLRSPASVEVQSCKFFDVKFKDKPYEGRQGATYATQLITETRSYPKGTLLVRTNQRAAKVAIHLLEPKSGDSFVAWGFFNSIFEQKEFAESYVMEKEGEKMLAENAGLRREFEQKIKSDTAFANSPTERLNWLYLRSQWADPWLNKYPVGRVLSADALGKLH